MTIEARTRFFGIVIRRTPIEIGRTFQFVEEEHWLDHYVSVPKVVEVISSDAIRITSDRSAVNELRTSMRLTQQDQEEVTLEREKIDDEDFVLRKFPGLETTLGWIPSFPQS